MGFLEARPTLTDRLLRVIAIVRWFCFSSCSSGIKVILTVYQNISITGNEKSLFGCYMREEIGKDHHLNLSARLIQAVGRI